MIVDFRRTPPPPALPHSPSWTALWLQWSHSDSWAPQELLIQFYSAIIESVLCTSITVWFSSATKSDLRRLRRLVRTAERIIGTPLPTLQELYLSRVSKRAGKITLDPSHPAHSLFKMLPSGRRYRVLSTRTTRHRNSFFPQAIHLMNTWHSTWNTQYYYPIIYSPHIHIFVISNLHMSDLFTTIVCSVYCVFCYFYCVFYYIVFFARPGPLSSFTVVTPPSSFLILHKYTSVHLWVWENIHFASLILNQTG